MAAGNVLVIGIKNADLVENIGRKEAAILEICKNNDNKIFEVWLTNAEKNDEAVRKRLKIIYAQGALEKYKVAVFESGNGDLYENTEHLLIQNMGMGM